MVCLYTDCSDRARTLASKTPHAHLVLGDLAPYLVLYHSGSRTVPCMFIEDRDLKCPLPDPSLQAKLKFSAFISNKDFPDPRVPKGLVDVPEGLEQFVQIFGDLLLQFEVDRVFHRRTGFECHDRRSF